MNKYKPSVSVVICTYTEERWEDLLSAVRSCSNQSLAPLETVVVVDHNPSMLERVRRELPFVLAVENREQKGLSGGRNTGIAVARGSLIAFLDDDAVADAGWLEWLVRACEDPAVLGAGGRVEPAWAAGPPSWFPAEFYWVLGCSYRGLPENTAPVRNPFGGCMCVRREVFDAVGGFSSGIGRVGKLPVGCEETELSIRAHQRWPGRQFIYEPRAFIRHRVMTDRTAFRYFRSRCHSEGISKALVSRNVGAGDALSSERRYALVNLPKGVLLGFWDLISRGDLTGPLRSGAIITGLALTGAGYIKGLSVMRGGGFSTSRNSTAQSPAIAEQID